MYGMAVGLSYQAGYVRLSAVAVDDNEVDFNQFRASEMLSRRMPPVPQEFATSELTNR